jgi:tRNA pseudouridine55 synthase
MNPMNGLLLVDKPTGITSHDVVYRARRILGIRGIGHAGTLDPLASGLLVLLIGEATKVSDYLLNGDKGYEVTVRLGITTDSMDITGVVSREVVPDLTEDAIRAAVAGMSGTLELKVPVHSAVKVDGKKLYEFAHKGETPDVVPSREMRFYDVETVSVDPQRVRVRMKCSKGSFIRAWANELGLRLGCGACVEVLKRVSSAPFEVSQAIGLEELEAKWNARADRHGSAIGPAWIPLRDSLPHFRRLDVDGQDERLLKNGQISVGVRARLLQFVSAFDTAAPPVRVIASETDDLLALLVAEPGEFYKVKRVFHRV